MAKSILGTASPTSSGRVSIDLAETDLDRLGSVIPDSQPTNAHAFTHPNPRKFSATKDDLSESVLSEGFSWRAKAPPRPGQFSKRPTHQPIQSVKPAILQIYHHDTIPDSAQPSVQGESVIPQTPASQHPVRVAAPLHLPELGLSGDPPLSDSHTSDGLSSDETPCQPEVSGSDGSNEPETLFERGSENPTCSLDAPKSSSRSPSENQELHRPSRPSPPGLGVDTQTNGANLPFGNVSSLSFAQPTNSITPATHVPRTIASHLDNLKLPMPHVARVGDNAHQSPSRSICGDLERPTPQTPRSHQRTRRDRISSSIVRPIPSSRHHEKADIHSRSQSRASNISRKRSSVQKSRPRADPERKKNAMNQVAQQWNECMRIVEDERDEAHCEIERLQTEIRQREENLHRSRHLLSNKDEEIQATQSRCKALEEQEGEMKAKNEQLTEQVELLQDQLNESKKRADGLVEKSRTYRAKLNETISEQQAFFKRSNDFYNDAQKELAKERESQAHYAKTIDQAIEDSRQKREKLKECLHEFQHDTELKSQKKDAAIVGLEEKLKHKEVELHREQEITTKLQDQIQDQIGISKSICDVETRVHELVEAQQQNDNRSSAQGKMISDLSEKLDLVFEDLKQSAKEAPPTLDLNPVIAKLEQSIVSRILPVVLTTVSEQTRTAESVSQLKSDLVDELGRVRGDINDQNERINRDRQQFEEYYLSLTGNTEHVVKEMDQTRETCRQAVQQLEEVAEKFDGFTEQFEELAERSEEFAEQRAQMQESNSSIQEQITSQLRDRETQITQLEKTIRSLMEHYATEMLLLKDKMSQSDKNIERYLEVALSQVRKTLDESFVEERDKVQRNLAKSELTRAELETQLRETREELVVAKNTRYNSDAAELRQNLGKERRTVADLQQRLQKFEHEAQTTTSLRDKWLQDIQAIDTVRSRLEDISKRAPQTDGLEECFQKIVKVNKVIVGVSGYLDAEHAWVDRLRSTSGNSVALRKETTASRSSEEVGVGDVTTTDHPAAGIVNEEVSSSDSNQTELAGQTTSQCKELEARRRVMVNSPFKVPSPHPPSVEQEKIQRRVAVAPRSILKQPQIGSSQDSQNNTSQTLNLRANHTQYNRPVASKASITSSAVDHQMIQQIRESMLPPKPNLSTWTFPTIEDFEKEKSDKAVPSGLDETDDRSTPETELGPPMKKLKMTQASFKNEVIEITAKAPVQSSETKQRAGNRPRVLRTYSRKPSA